MQCSGDLASLYLIWAPLVLEWAGATDPCFVPASDWTVSDLRPIHSDGSRLIYLHARHSPSCPGCFSKTAATLLDHTNICAAPDAAAAYPQTHCSLWFCPRVCRSLMLVTRSLVENRDCELWRFGVFPFPYQHQLYDCFVWKGICCIGFIDGVIEPVIDRHLSAVAEWLKNSCSSVKRLEVTRVCVYFSGPRVWLKNWCY